MGEQETKPTQEPMAEEPTNSSTADQAEQAGQDSSNDEQTSEAELSNGIVRGAPPFISKLLFAGLTLVAILAVGFWWGSQRSAPPETAQLQLREQAAIDVEDVTGEAAVATSRPTQMSPLQALAQQPSLPSIPVPTATATAVAVSELVVLPTVTPTLVQTVDVTRAVEIRGEAMIQMSLGDNQNRRGQPVTMPIESQTFIVDGNVGATQAKWCKQAGVAAVVFDLTLRLTPDQSLQVNGSMNLHDGFCEDLGQARTGSPISLVIPADATAQIVQSVQAEMPLFGVDNLLDTTTGVFVELTIRNTRPR